MSIAINTKGLPTLKRLRIYYPEWAAELVEFYIENSGESSAPSHKFSALKTDSIRVCCHETTDLGASRDLVFVLEGFRDYSLPYDMVMTFDDGGSETELVYRARGRSNTQLFEFNLVLSKYLMGEGIDLNNFAAVCEGTSSNEGLDQIGPAYDLMIKGSLTAGVRKGVYFAVKGLSVKHNLSERELDYLVDEVVKLHELAKTDDKYYCSSCEIEEVVISMIEQLHADNAISKIAANNDDTSLEL